MSSNMQNNENKVMAALSKAQMLIHKDSVNNIGNSKGNVSSIYDVPSDVGYMAESVSTANYSIPSNDNYVEDSVISSYGSTQPRVMNTSLPTEIFESMTKNYINTDELKKGVPELGGSILDNFSLPKQRPVKKDIIKEVTQNSVQSSNIDYSLIKTIVEDCVKKYTSALKKSIINESKESLNEVGTLQAMKIGDKFSFIDGNGNLYEAKLTFIKNINKKGGK